MNWNLEEALTYYRRQGAPADQSALIALLREIQQEHGGSIPAPILPEIAESYGIRESLLQAIIKRIPSLRLGNTHCLELCAGPNCAKASALAASAEKLQKEAGFVLKYVPCMRQCGKGPNLKWDGTLYHGGTEELLRQLAKGGK